LDFTLTTHAHWFVKVSLSLDGGALPNPTEEDAKVSSGTELGHATQATASQIIDVNTGIGFLDHVVHFICDVLRIDVPCPCKTFRMVTSLAMSG
jgi:imidazoleglycerol phosphate dehydratase HisB